jgi:peroxiredoxin
MSIRRGEVNMKTGILLVLALVTILALVITACSSPACPDIGNNAPDFTLPTADGGTASLNNYRGKMVVMNIWATWCPPCIEEMPLLQEIHSERSGKGLVVLSIDKGESAAKVQNFLLSQPFTFPVLIDAESRVSALYCLPSLLPQTLIISRDGIIKARKIGALRNKQEVVSLLDSSE